ncbi:TraR/DksA family transcriptional regulator [Noviherbaspirillum sp. UKPF54]|uniref:TraR/DksA family transcriptional regulator n=1 Tax=Noviherbaspirillum sp. UKPF54 TaxID=2601898 RepID=UPI0011B116EC|nr:TraR/DksA family transcriptional regulator [Noviherbaspirillum sp. UKPF54]QDZ27466.1 TraR/DksA family transcriptional regulator [Noviherbaspirillum sp. UKPF54]
MAYLSDEQLAHLKQLLDEREQVLRADLLREVNEKDEYMEVATEIPDPGDSSFANLAVDLGNAAVTRDLTELRAVEAARRRMENGVYGVCVSCESEIPYERLKVQPTAERCAPCQEHYEKTHGDALRGNTM